MGGETEETEFMGGETEFMGDLYERRITELTEDFHRNTEGLTQQVQTVDKKVEELGIKIDNMDVKFEELKHLIMGFQNQGSTAVKLESGETSKKRNRPTCIEEVHNRRPTGREEQGDIRCLSLERGAESLEFLCKYHTLDVKFEELKQLIMGFQNQGKTAVKLESDETSTKRKRSTCIEEVHNRRPTGREEQGDIRCLALERGAESLELLCKYHTLGCPEILSNYNKLKHEAVCSFRPYSCPYAGSECAVIGDIPFLVSHLRDDHKVDMHTGCTFHHRYVKSNPREVTNATWMLTVFHCFGQYFCLHFEAFVLGVTPVYMAFLRLMDDEADARNYSYSLEVGGNGRKLTWEGIPRSIRDSHRKVRDSHDGLIIQRNMALFFSGGERKELKLRVAGRIWKRGQNSEAGVCTSNLCT